MEIDSYEAYCSENEMIEKDNDWFYSIDPITGERGNNLLNSKNLNKYVLDSIFNIGWDEQIQ